MQHDDDDDNAIAREIIKEIRARKHKGEIRENDHYQPKRFRHTKRLLSANRFCSLWPMFLLAQCAARWGEDDEQGGHYGNIVHPPYKRIEKYLRREPPGSGGSLVVPVRQPHTHNTAALVSDFWSFRTHEAPSQIFTALSHCTAVRIRCGQNDTAVS